MSISAKLLVVFGVLCLLVANVKAYSFFGLGDWGGAAITEYTHNVVNVASQMVATAKETPPAFIINTGDNFYWCGIQNTTDFQVKTDWVDPYSAPELNQPWYSILGNHEYGYNVDAQIELGKVYAKWVMDSRYYTRRVKMDDTNYVSMIFLDTSPCVSDYRGTNDKYWDPCNPTYPTCSLNETDDDFEGECLFHSNIMSQSCDDQYAWLSQALNNVPKDDWLIIAGHHPLDEVNVLDFTSLVEKHGFSLYINGHTHALIQYTIDKAGAYVTTGAGALVNTPDQEAPTTSAKHRGENLEAPSASSSSATASSSTHSYQTVYYAQVAGFTQHIFDSKFTQLTTNFIAYNGTIIHSFVSDKTGKVLSTK